MATILVIGDEESVLMVFHAALAQTGHRVLICRAELTEHTHVA